jgi:glutamyl-tRNA reductase
MLIGAGEMAELAVEHLIRNRAGAITVANRTFARGVELAGAFPARPFVSKKLSTASGCGYRHQLHRRHRLCASQKADQTGHEKSPQPRLFFIDIAVPRDIDPEINRINNAYVYDIDDLKGIVDENIEDRNREAMKARRIIDEAVIGFRRWYDTLAVVPTIVSLRDKVETSPEVSWKKPWAR